MKRIRDYGIIIGKGKTGKLNKITDVPGVNVGHYTVDDERHKTGVTVIMPCEDNMFKNKIRASSFVINGYGKTQGLVQVDELGYMETPIFLTNTLNVGKVYDGAVSYMIDRCNSEGITVTSINPIVGECNDATLNDIQDRILDENSVREAISNLVIDFAEGDVGAGKGTICCGVKGGIGSASRLTLIDGKFYTIGVLVQTNFGGAKDLIINGIHAGDKIAEKTKSLEIDKGSIMIVVATDLPVSTLQLKRIIKRTEVGLARTGSNIGHYSGDVVVGFTTANRIDTDCTFNVINEISDAKLDYVFKMVADATEEAILNSLAMAKPVTGYKGVTKYGLTDIYLKEFTKSKKYQAFIEKFEPVNQFPDYPVGCESVALYSLLKYYGVNCTVEDIVDRLAKGKLPYAIDGELYGGNPEIEFIGDPRDVYSYGVYESPIMEVANYFKSGMKRATGSSLNDILKLVNSGSPVQVWISINLIEPHVFKTWKVKETGEEVNWLSPLHSVVIIGYNDDVVVVADPDSGAIRDFDRLTFEKIYNYFGKRALYYED